MGILPLGLGCIRGRRICSGEASICESTSSPVCSETPGTSSRARNASPSKSSGLKVSWSRTVTTKQAPGVWHWSSETRLGYKKKLTVGKRGRRCKKFDLWDCRTRGNGNDLQIKGLVEKRIEITAFVLGAARLYLGKDVVRLQAQPHEGVTEACQATKGHSHR